MVSRGVSSVLTSWRASASSWSLLTLSEAEKLLPSECIVSIVEATFSASLGDTATSAGGWMEGLWAIPLLVLWVLPFEAIPVIDCVADIVVEKLRIDLGEIEKSKGFYLGIFSPLKIKALIFHDLQCFTLCRHLIRLKAWGNGVDHSCVFIAYQPGCRVWLNFRPLQAGLDLQEVGAATSQYSIEMGGSRPRFAKLVVD
jgi:hypothetical protein